MPVAVRLSPKRAPRSARLMARLERHGQLNDYDPFRFRMRTDDPTITLPVGRDVPALLCILLCRRVWVIAIDNASDSRIRVDRWDLFCAAADVSDEFRDLPTETILQAVVAAGKFFGLDGYSQA